MITPRGESGPVQLREARIIDVDPSRYIARIQFLRTEEPAEAVVLAAEYVASRGGGWMGAVPEENDICLVASPTRSSSHFIIAYRPFARVENREDTEGNSLHAFNQPRNNFAAGRNPVNPGDMGMWGSYGNRVAIRRSGIVEVLADTLCSTRWFPDEKAIRSVSAILENIGYWGASSFYTDRDPQRIREGRTPTGYSAWVKTHAEASPVVNIEAGAIRDEEDTRLPGAPRPNERRRGTLVFRFLVFDQDMADRYAALGESPDPAAARFAIRVDEAGNCTWYSAGALTQYLRDHTQYIAGRETRQIQGSSRTQAQGDVDVEALETARVTGGRRLNLSSGGDVVIECNRFVVRARNDDIETDRNYRIRAGGTLTLRTASALVVSAGGDATTSYGRTSSEVIGGRKVINVLGSADIENTGRDVPNYQVRVQRGKTQIQSITGSLELLMGPPGAPVAQIKMHQDPKLPGQIGRITIGFPLTGQGLTLSPDGSWELSGPQAAIKSDVSGRIQLGRNGVPVVGNVVTTLTHPVDFVTGMPIQGSADVVVSAGATAPLSGVPSPGPQPQTINLPDEPVS